VHCSPGATIRLPRIGLTFFKVLRYSALLFGIFYGFSHQRTIAANNKASHVEHEYKHKESLIEKAKLEWKKKNMPPEARTAGGGS
jgi:F-type H+-transporting ATP synthase subunit e